MKKGCHVPSLREIPHLRNWSDIYVFALLADEKHQLSITDACAWTFYLLPTYKLDILRRVTKKPVKSISVAKLLEIGAVQSSFFELRTRMQFIVDSHYPKLVRWKFAHNELKMRYGG